MNLMELCSQHGLNDTDRRILLCISDLLTGEDGAPGVREVARRSYVSTSTVIRLARKLGYRGYSDMMYVFREHAARERSIDVAAASDEPPPIAGPDCISAFVEGLLAHRDRCIYVCGLGNSTVTAGYIAKRLSILGIPAYDGSPFDVIRSDIRPGMVLLLSKRGSAPEQLRIASYARDMGYAVYAITANADSALACMSDHCLVVQSDSSSAYAIPDFFVGRSILLFEHILAGLWRRMNGGRA